jgi:hypothetical protein
MKLKMIVLALAVASSAFATTVELNQKRINLGNLGAGDVVAQNGDFTLERTAATPKRVKLSYQIKVTETQCIQYEQRRVSCGYRTGPYRGGRGGRPGRPYPGNGPGYGNGYPGPGYPGPGYPGYGVCYQTVCAQYGPVVVNKNKKLKLNFRRAVDLIDGEVENFDVQISAVRNTTSYEVTAPANYRVKERRSSIKFINSIK